MGYEREKEVLKQILDFASEEHRVRAVMMNGSRVNNNGKKDKMQDYDVVFFITDIEVFCGTNIEMLEKWQYIN